MLTRNIFCVDVDIMPPWERPTPCSQDNTEPGLGLKCRSRRKPRIVSMFLLALQLLPHMAAGLDRLPAKTLQTLGLVRQESVFKTQKGFIFRGRNDIFLDLRATH